MGNNPSWYKGSSNPPDGGEEQGKRPVENMDWYKAISFCNELSKACGLEPCYTEIDIEENNAVCDLNKNGFRLPTEAEWEWAAMGGKDYKWAGTDSESELGNYAWCYANSNEKTHQVKLKLPNGYGLYDMSGNVFEWCWTGTAAYPMCCRWIIQVLRPVVGASSAAAAMTTPPPPLTFIVRIGPTTSPTYS